MGPVQIHAVLSGQNQGMLIKIFKQRLVFDFWIMNDREVIRKPAWGRSWGEKDGDKAPPGQQPCQDVAVDSTVLTQLPAWWEVRIRPDITEEAVREVAFC